MPNQKQPSKKTAQGFFDQACTRLFGTTVDFRQLGNVGNIAKNNYKLGLEHLERGNLSDAILRFKMVVWFEPRHRDAWYQLGRAQLMAGQKPAAIASFRRALKAAPKHEEAAYMLAIAEGSAKATRIPVSLAQPHFDKLAATYASEQLVTYKYKGHVQLAEALRAQLQKDRANHVILDMGVGTGLAGSQLRSVASNLVGVDFSAKMLDEAAKLEGEGGVKIYDSLVKRELHEFLTESAAEAFDIVIAANTLNYIGELQPLFAQVAQALKPGGLFAFTADKKDGQDFRFIPLEGRFAYSKTYLTMAASAAGLKPVSFDETPAYPDAPMWLGIFRK